MNNTYLAPFWTETAGFRRIRGGCLGRTLHKNHQLLQIDTAMAGDSIHQLRLNDWMDWIVVASAPESTDNRLIVIVAAQAERAFDSEAPRGAEMRAEIRSASHVAKEVPRLRTYVQSWLASKALGLKVSTATMYSDTLGSYVLPHLGDFFIDRISDADVRGWQAKLAEELSGATVNGALVMLRMVLADAVVEYGMLRNPAARVRRLPVRKFTDAEPNLLTADELPRILTALRQHIPGHYPLAATLALTGVRFGEGTALK